MGRTARVRRQLADSVGRYPLVPVAVKAAVAAALAWLVARPIGGPADEYAYYAPLGAVVTVSSRLTQSLRWSLEAVLAIALGAILALGARWAPVPAVVAIGLVVGPGTLIGAWRRVGSMAGWVPISALFVLIVGGPHPARYVLAYLGLTALGAAVGVVVNFIAPPLPLIATRNVQNSLRDILADQLDGLAEGLQRDQLPTSEEWKSGQARLENLSQRAQELVAQTLDSSRMNWRVRRWKDTTDRHRRQGQALNELTFQVRQMTTLLAHQEHADRTQVALGPDLRPSASQAFRETARALRSVRFSTAGDQEQAAALRAADNFAEAILQRQDGDHGETFAAGALVTALRQVLLSIAPDDDPLEPAPG